jgi:hypothetical protein
LKSASAESLLQKTWTFLCSDTIVHSKILKYLIGKKSIEHDWAGMRDPREKRSSLKYPLDDILGSPGVVRLLRVLFHEAFAPVGVEDAADKAGLSVAGARRALSRLAGLGIAERLGTGRALKFGPVPDHPFSSLLSLLFEKEQENYEDLIGELRRTLAIPEVLSAWIEKLPYETGNSLNIVVVTEPAALGRIREDLRDRLIETEKKFDIIIELKVLIRADEPVMPEEAIPLRLSGNERNGNRLASEPSQYDSEQRSLKLAKAIAGLIRHDPSLIRRAIQYTGRLLDEEQGMAGRDIAEWQQILENYSSERLQDLLVSGSSRAVRLRRSMPFLAVLTQGERERMLTRIEDSQ